MSVEDVRGFLLKQLAELADSDMTSDEANVAIEKAKATSLVAATYVNAVRAEIEAVKVYDETGLLAGGVDAPLALPRPKQAIGNDRGQS